MGNIIIFDVDGVLLDTMPIWANSANEYLKEAHGIIAPPELDRECSTMSLMESGEYIRSLYPQIDMTARELADGVADFIRERYWKAPEMPGMTNVVKWLREQGCKLYLATASERENVRGALTNLGVWDCFDDIYTCTEIGYSKSYVEYYEEVARRIGVPPKELVMVEDSLHSMVSAKKAGLTVVGVYEASSAEKEEDIRAVADVYLHSLSEMKSVLVAMVIIEVLDEKK